MCYKFTERGYSDEEEEGEFSSVEEADEMTYGGGPARRRAHRQLAFNKADMSYTKVPPFGPLRFTTFITVMMLMQRYLMVAI